MLEYISAPEAAKKWGIHQVQKDQILSNQAPKPPQGANGPDGTGCGSERAIRN